MKKSRQEHGHPEGTVYDTSSGWIVWHMRAHHGWDRRMDLYRRMDLSLAFLYNEHARIHGQPDYLVSLGADEPQTELA